jgi:peptide/nickel transport system substrate-binding protein
MEANENYWRKTPSVKRLVFRPYRKARHGGHAEAGEVDIAYLLEGPQAEEVKRDPNLRLAFSGGIAIFYLDFLDQWDPKSPWHDRRVRLAANYAIDRQALSDAETLGASKPTGNHVPQTFEFALPIDPYPYDPAKAKQLLAEAGYPNGFDAGELHQLPPYFSLGEAIVGYLQAVGIRTKMRVTEARHLHGSYSLEKAKGLCVCSTALYGNAASRLSEVIPSDGTWAYGGYADIDALFKQQAVETDRPKREAMLHDIQRLVHERVRYGPIFQYVWPSGVGRRVAEPALMLIDPYRGRRRWKRCA